MRTYLIVWLACASLGVAACGGSAVAPSAPPTQPAPPAPTVSLVTLTIEGNASFNVKGETSQLKAMATLSDGRVEDRTATADWSSSDASVAAVNRSGLLTAMSDGRTVVTAKIDAIAAARTVLVDLPQDR